ncbi:hypothetical protein CPB83DRAFT_309370 [Crepidotus variabilis]|uniref:Uncharacterized protein n=1 Tax=Crepidotus variabilis TaxID=179855 RepID=A0A9P6JQM1_9AGAR|nr:hypothetical protein CPB83DRAFT_309370 [Crepidotus variabilis]
MTGELMPQSVAFRANLAQLVSRLRRVRSRTPFFRLAAHRIPTLWSLYRGLLRASPTEPVKFRVRALFRLNQHLTGIEKTKEKLLLGYKWLEFFQKAQGGNPHCQLVMERYSRLIEEKRAKADLKRILKGELENQLRMRTQPIYTGGFIRPTMFHGPLPRMKPQPEHISMTIRNRIRAREKRITRQAEMQHALRDLELEREFEEGLLREANGNLVSLFSPDQVFNEWTRPIHTAVQDAVEKEIREIKRINTPFSPEMFEKILEARREKVRNKTREKERERRGELTSSAIRRLRRGPPAHVLERMTPKQRAMDKIARSGIEVGYVALVKSRLGMKLKDPDTALEQGQKVNQHLLDEARDVIRKENDRRMREEAKSWVGE